MSDLLNSASLVMIPSGYKEDTVYSVVPSDGSGDLSFTRASNGTRVNSAGLVEDVPWNLATNSEDYTLWNLANVTVTANDITAPNGTLTADKLTISSNGNDVKQTISVMPNSVYTWTFYVYGGTALGQQMRFYDNTNSTNIEYYDYSSSVVLGAWVKIERTFTTPSGCYQIQAWVLAATSTIGTMWVWGAQLNIGATAKPYFPTTDRLNVPRLTYQNGGGGCPSLLLEKQSTNVALYSEQINSTNYNLNNVTSSENSLTSPDGTTNADKIIESTSNSQHSVTFAVSLGGTVDSSPYCISVFVKAEGRSNILFYDNNQAVGGISYFNLSTGVVTSGTGKIENYGNGWYRLTIFCLKDNSTSANIQLYLQDDAGNTTYTGNGTSGIGLWGYQCEASSYPTSYIPTTSSSATRVADACFKTGISSLIGQTSGTLFADFKVDNANPSARIISVSDGTFANRIVLLEDGLFIRVYVATASVVQTDISFGTWIGRHKIALAYANNDLVVFLDGVLVATDTSISVPTCSAAQVGTFENNTDATPLQGTVNQAVIFPTRLTNSELASLTTL